MRLNKIKNRNKIFKLVLIIILFQLFCGIKDYENDELVINDTDSLIVEDNVAYEILKIFLCPSITKFGICGRNQVELKLIKKVDSLMSKKILSIKRFKDCKLTYITSRKDISYLEKDLNFIIFNKEINCFYISYIIENQQLLKKNNINLDFAILTLKYKNNRYEKYILTYIPKKQKWIILNKLNNYKKNCE